ncbi:hypothetical protein HRS9139_09107 [Pyrenophora teres f. teres]|nr:hypothetical protein HRS9139_09107 [Pyrenophora teres f. teres]
MASDDESNSRSKRPTAMTRQSSSQSHISQSPSDSHQRTAHHKTQRHHVVGQRVQRNTSFGKNLNKLSKAEKQAVQAQQAAESTGRHHRRTQSGNSVSAPSSPRPGFKRHASSGAIVRANQAHVQANIRRNHSSGQLPPRQGHAKHALKSSKHENGPSKRALATPRESRTSSPEPHAAVHFEMPNDDEEGDDGGWTEESASQSPTTTRSNTRSNSVILEAQHRAAEINMEKNRGEPPQQANIAREPPAQPKQTLTDRTRSNTQINGGSSYQHSRPPDADMITSRLLQRSASHHVPPQTTSVAATVVSSSDRHNLLNHTAGSVGSTLVDTPGRDLVSRFMDGDGSAGTPHDGTYMSTNHNNYDSTQGELDMSKRNKSMPNFSGADTPSKTPQRSGTTTPTNLPPSRTQQKLMLQRASSNIEPQKLVPVTLPRTGGPTYLQSSVHYNTNGEGRLDPRLQQQFNHVAVEYNVVRRYRNPVADALGRIHQIPGMSRKTRMPKSSNGNGIATGASSLSTSFNDGPVETDAGSRRSRVSFENDQSRGKTSRGENEVEGEQSLESDQARSRNEAEEICRRLWESAEVVEAD